MCTGLGTTLHGAPKPMSDCLGKTGKTLVGTCKPLPRLVRVTSTFVIRKNKETVENCLQTVQYSTIKIQEDLMGVFFCLLLNFILFKRPCNSQH